MSPLGILAAPLAALLGFSIQLLLAKHLLPLFGGASSVWLGSSLYFQLALVLGHAWAVFVLRLPPRAQAGSVVGLGLLAVFTFHLPSTAAEAPGVAQVVLRLAPGSLAAMLLLFSISPLLHGWVRGADGRPPYHLYALSNAGSLLGLAAYPFLIEPFVGLGLQVAVWRALLAILAATLSVAALVVWHRAPARASAASRAPAAFPWKLLPLWLGLSALGVLHLLAVTHHVSAEIGAHPLAWSGPLGLYLLAFTFAFSTRWRPWMTRLCVAILGVALAGLMVEKGFTVVAVRGPVLALLALVSAAGGFLGAALLNQSRPASRPEIFYLALGSGGALGGLVAAHWIPRLLPMPVEVFATSLFLLFAGVLWITACRRPADIAIVFVVLAAPVLFLGFHQLNRHVGNVKEVVRLRDEVGNITLEISPASVVLSSDSTTHGSQLTGSPEARRRPTLYYTESSALGVALRELQFHRPSIRVGSVGLGAGTLAAYARPEDQIDFWDIDPKSLRVAREYFTFVGDSAGTIELIQADGRKALQATDADYDLLLIDAFTGDAIPAHLLTREAIELFFRRLSRRDGFLLYHISSRSADYFPVLEATARSLGLAAIAINTRIREATEDSDWDPSQTDYVILCRPARFFETLAWFPPNPEDGRVVRQLRASDSPDINPRKVWTDDRNATLDALDVGKYLFGH